jgi:hypothetical protein
MGIEDFCRGRHTLRNEKRWRIGELDVSHAWHASIFPSFDDHAVVAVALAHDTAFRGETIPGFFRAGIAIVALDTSALKQVVIADIEDDPLPGVMDSLDLFAKNDSLSLDGIAYELNINTDLCCAKIRFSNPTVPCFRRIEDALFTVAKRIADVSGEATVAEYVAIWRSYIAESGRTTRHGRSAESPSE